MLSFLPKGKGWVCVDDGIIVGLIIVYCEGNSVWALFLLIKY